ncbi:hypothetical protein BS78_05G180300 [Paspalum vaginatum]|nr:hypothetical protein BS78_05G180300 [Paspalum vaginatum]
MRPRRSMILLFMVRVVIRLQKTKKKPENTRKRRVGVDNMVKFFFLDESGASPISKAGTPIPTFTSDEFGGSVFIWWVLVESTSPVTMGLSATRLVFGG